jgi:hypothetical protein
MATIWLTYAWKDNEARDVDFIAQELENAGVTIKLDRWTIGAGKRLWDQIENFIQNDSESDAWLLYVTANSLGSEPCKEEYAYALDRALRTRGDKFPVIGLFSGTVDPSLIPAGIRTRLYVSLTDPDWKERIVAAARGRTPAIAKDALEPYSIHIHEKPLPDRNFAIEVRPRAGTWSPFIVGVPMMEKDTIRPSILHGPANVPPTGGVLYMTTEGPSQGYWVQTAHNEATPTQSYFLFCDVLPSRIIFGVDGRQPQFDVQIRK